MRRIDSLMRRWQFHMTMVMGVTNLVMVCFLIWIGYDNGRLQKNLQLQQSEIVRGSQSREVGLNLLADMARISVVNTNMKTILKRNGYSVDWQPDPTNAVENPESTVQTNRVVPRQTPLKTTPPE